MTATDINHIIARANPYETHVWLWRNSGQVWTCEYLNVKMTQFWIRMNMIRVKPITITTNSHYKEHVYDFNYLNNDNDYAFSNSSSSHLWDIYHCESYSSRV